MLQSPAWNHYIWVNCPSLCSLSGRGTNLVSTLHLSQMSLHRNSLHWDHFSELLWDLMNANDSRNAKHCMTLTKEFLVDESHTASWKGQCDDIVSLARKMSWKHVINTTSWWVWAKICCSYPSRKIFDMYFGRVMLSTPARHDSCEVSSWTENITLKQLFTENYRRYQKTVSHQHSSNSHVSFKLWMKWLRGEMTASNRA